MREAQMPSQTITLSLHAAGRLGKPGLTQALTLGVFTGNFPFWEQKTTRSLLGGEQPCGLRGQLEEGALLTAKPSKPLGLCRTSVLSKSASEHALRQALVQKHTCEAPRQVQAPGCQQAAEKRRFPAQLEKFLPELPLTRWQMAGMEPQVSLRNPPLRCSSLPSRGLSRLAVAVGTPEAIPPSRLPSEVGSGCNACACFPVL